MNDSGYDRLDEVTVDVVLIGGPADLPETERSRKGAIADRKIKIAHRGGYEHFELTGRTRDHGDSARIIFRWTMRTKIAE
jgi:hypothetical protein